MSAGRVLVTGGAGTIGTALVRRLLDDDFAVRVADQRPAFRETATSMPRHALNGPSVSVSATGPIATARPSRSRRACVVEAGSSSR